MAKMTKRGEDEGKHGHSVKLGIKGISPMKGETQKNYDARARKAWALCKKTKDSQGNIKCKGAMHHATKFIICQAKQISLRALLEKEQKTINAQIRGHKEKVQR